jgi:hypothetical protein
VKQHQKVSQDHLENLENLDHPGEWELLERLEHKDHLVKLEVKKV